MQYLRVRKPITLSVVLLIWSGIGPVAAQEISRSSNEDSLPKHAMKRLGSLRFLPSSTTDRIDYSADGQHLATLSIPEVGHVHPTIHIWERKSGRDVTPVELRGVETTGVSWAPAGNRFATTHEATNLGTCLNLWTIGDNKPQSFVAKDVPYSTVAWAPAGDRLAVRTWSHETVLFSLKGTEQHRFQTARSKHSIHGTRWLDFSPDGKQLVTVTDAGAQLIDAATGATIAEFKVTAETIWAVRILPDGNSVGVATDRGIVIYKIDAPDAIAMQFEKIETLDFAVSRDGKWLVTSGFLHPKGAAIWDLKTGAKVHLFANLPQGGVAFAPDDSELALSTRRISFLKVGNWELLSSKGDPISFLYSGVMRGDQLWTSGLGAELREWNVRSGESVRTMTRASGPTTAMVMIDDKHLATAGGESQIEIVDVTTGATTSTLPGHTSFTYMLACAPQQHRLISWGGDGFLKVWNLQLGSLEYEFPEKAEFGFVDLNTSPNGDFFVGGNTRTQKLHLFRLSDGERLWTKNSRVGFAKPTFLPDSSAVVGTVNHPDQNLEWLYFWDAASGRRKSRLNCGASLIRAMALSPDSRLLAISPAETGDSSIQIWSLADKECIATLNGHYDSPRWMSFTADSRRLVSLAQDTTVLIWDVDAAIRGYVQPDKN
jgi:WD40 repeat protein